MSCGCVRCQNNKPFDMPAGIVESALNGDLVLFCGAGISTESKNVLPFTFYTEVMEELALDDTSLSFSELMQRYCSQPNGRKKLIAKIKARFANIHSFPELERAATQFHKELAELHFIKTIITTNWDTYFEEYCAATPITIPEDYAFYNEQERFVLKIHGSISNLSTIVATKDDYNRCLKRLKTNLIGARLKDIFARKTVVFIGFSFGDDDLNQILRYVRSQMKEFIPHIYIVSLDESLCERLGYRNATHITTDGSFFLHCLKNIFIEKKVVANCDAKRSISEAMDRTLEFHDELSKYDVHQNPCLVYCLAYQDGVIHAFERFFQMYPTGDYNHPCYMHDLIIQYQNRIDQRCESGNFSDEAYYEGYLNALVLIAVCSTQPDAIESFPYLYLPNADTDITDLDGLFTELDRLDKSEDEYSMYARNMVQNLEEGITIHHPPY